MTEYTSDNNWVEVSGSVDSIIEFSHEMFGEGFYGFYLSVPRLSDYVDRLPIIVSERLITDVDLNIGAEITITGQFRSYNKMIDGSNRLLLTVFVREITNMTEEFKNPNQIYLNGFVCKAPIYRTTPFKREIADLLVAVNRAYNKSDYIPTIAWGRNAKFCQTLEVGDNIKVWGRIQSREYQKRYANGEVVDKVAYEVSVSKLEIVQDKVEKEIDQGKQLENTEDHDHVIYDEES